MILGLRLTGAFMFDQPFYMTWLWPIVRIFLSEKLRSRFHLCGSDYDKIKEVRSADSRGDWAFPGCRSILHGHGNEDCRPPYHCHPP